MSDAFRVDLSLPFAFPPDPDACEPFPLEPDAPNCGFAASLSAFFLFSSNLRSFAAFRSASSFFFCSCSAFRVASSFAIHSASRRDGSSHLHR
jgi:hypothetical protein